MRFIGISLTLWLGTHASLATADQNKDLLGESCKEFIAELYGLTFADMTLETLQQQAAAQNQFFVQATPDLDENQRFRLEPVFMELLSNACLLNEYLTAFDDAEKEAIIARQEALPIATAIAQAQEGLDLDPSLRGWGLVDVPEIDLSQIACEDWRSEFGSIKEQMATAAEKYPEFASNPRRYTASMPENDPFTVAIRRFRSSLKPQSIEALLDVTQIGARFPVMCARKENETRPMLDILQEEAISKGLL